MSLDIDVLTEQAARAQVAVCDTEPDGWAVISPKAREGWLRETTAALAVIVPAVTAEVRALHSSTDEPTSDHYHCRPSECDQAGEGSLKPVCDECDMPSPCPTVRLLDELDAAARGERP